MKRLLVNLGLRAGGFVAGLAMLIAPRATLRLIEHQLKVILAQKFLEATLEREGL